MHVMQIFHNGFSTMTIMLPTNKTESKLIQKREQETARDSEEPREHRRKYMMQHHMLQVI